MASALKKPQEIVQVLNIYFSKLGEELDDYPQLYPTLFLLASNKNELLNIIATLENNKGSEEELSIIMTHVINPIFSKSIIKIIYLFKRGDYCCTINTGIAVMLIFSKVFEKVK